jgi:hypothetical protein
MSKTLSVSLEDIECNEHAGSRLCFLNTTKNDGKKLLCPRCLLKHKIPYEYIMMVDDFVREKDCANGPSTITTKEELDIEEKRIDEAWTQQTKKVEEELDEILDEFSNMIDELKMRFKEALDARRVALRRRKEDLVACIQEHTERTSLPDLESI